MMEREQERRYQYIEKDIPQYFSSLSEIEAVMSSIYSKTMLETSKKLDENVVNRICNRIASSDSVDIYGVGISKSVADQLCFKLSTLGYNVKSHGGINYLYINSTKQKNNVSILFTLSGRNTLIKEIAHYLKSSGIYTVVISCDKRSVNQMDFDCHEILFFDTSVFEDLEGITFIFGAEYISNLIYATLNHRKTLSKRL